MARPKGTRVKKRLSISLEPSSYASLERLATDNDVSVAWLVRRAVAEFTERQSSDQTELPLVRTGSTGEGSHQ